jgi:arsenite methyltransferase
MNENESNVHQAVREHYKERITSSSACCGNPDNGGGSEMYPESLLSTLPDGERPVSYGCGDPVTLAELKPGQTVLDLGSGAGLDCLFAAKKVGPGGHVIGVDMTPEMVERASATASKLGMENVEFRLGMLEELPVESSSVDVVISNCVINLAPNKTKVFDEIFRVLKPGGRLAVSDIVTDGPLPQSIKDSLSAWAGCIAGALDVKDYREMMERASLTKVTLTPAHFDEAAVEEAMSQVGLGAIASGWSKEDIARTVFSARITAWKPS